MGATVGESRATAVGVAPLGVAPLGVALLLGPVLMVVLVSKPISNWPQPSKTRRSKRTRTAVVGQSRNCGCVGDLLRSKLPKG